MEQSDLLRHIVSVLERLRLRYLVTGSTVTIFFGEPRFTNDIHVVVELREDQVPAFCREFPKDDYYVSEDAVREAIRHKSQFNIIHPTSGLKIDVIIPQTGAFNEIRFQRARRVHPARDYEAQFASPEDTIIKKMEFYREGGSEKHLRDITGVLKIQGEKIDRAYIERWPAQLGVLDIWQAILSRLAGTERRQTP